MHVDVASQPRRRADEAPRADADSLCSLAADENADKTATKAAWTSSTSISGSEPACVPTGTMAAAAADCANWAAFSG